jgi:hypothetical protein
MKFRELNQVKSSTLIHMEVQETMEEKVQEKKGFRLSGGKRCKCWRKVQMQECMQEGYGESAEKVQWWRKGCSAGSGKFKTGGKVQCFNNLMEKTYVMNWQEHT